MLDNLYLTNNYRVGAVEGQVNLDDLLTSTAGGVIRIKNPNALVPLTVQSSAAQSFPMLEYLDNVQAKRTGVSDQQQGLDPNSLQNTTATAVSTMSSAANGKLELIARIFAETGVKSLFQSIFRLLCKYQKQSRTIHITGQYVPFNPREWSENYGITINVGLGNGSRPEQLATLQMILSKQEQIIQGYGASNPLVNLKQYRDTLARMIHMAGFKDSSSFLNEITPEQLQQLSQPQPPQPDSNVQATQILAQVEREKAELRAKTEMAKLELEKQQMELDNARKQLELQQQAFKIQADAVNKSKQTQQSQTKTIVDALSQVKNMHKGM
jgi:hypothetical protein